MGCVGANQTRAPQIAQPAPSKTSIQHLKPQHMTGYENLAMCDKIMRQHDGNLTFRSSRNGTTFEMILPIQPAKTEQSG